MRICPPRRGFGYPHVGKLCWCKILPQQVNIGDATIGLTLTRDLINDLPLVNRNPFDLALLAPGVSQAPGATYGNPVGTPGFVTNFVSDGSRNAQADVLLDGVSVMNSDNNPGVQKAIYVPPVEAIQEFCQGRSESFPPERSKRDPPTVVRGVFRPGLGAAGAEPCDARRAERLGRSGSRLQTSRPWGKPTRESLSSSCCS